MIRLSSSDDDAALEVETQTRPGPWHWYNWQVILLITNAIVGICLLEGAWKKNVRFRKPIVELDQLMPAFRRYDAEKWAKWKHYPGAMTLMIPRFLIGITLGFIFCILISLALIG